MSHSSQILGVAERLGWPCTRKDIRYNKLAALANGPFGARFWHLDGPSRATLTPPWPDLVIAAGRRSAPVSLAIKKRSPSTKLVHLMWPDVAPARFDLIAVPEHDKLSYSGANLMRTFGAPHRMQAAALKAQADEWRARVAKLPRPLIAVLIGGPSKAVPYTMDDFKTLAAYASAEAERLSGALLLTSSPRTGAPAETAMKNILTAPHIFHRFAPGAENPYMAFLGLADAFIVTGDSVSMCSEACATGKPVYIFTPPHLERDPQSFRETLFARGSAKSHTYPIRLDWQPMPAPDAASQVAKAVMALMQ